MFSPRVGAHSYHLSAALFFFLSDAHSNTVLYIVEKKVFFSFHKLFYTFYSKAIIKIPLV